jgi:hypothetical protein
MVSLQAERKCAAAPHPTREAKGQVFYWLLPIGGDCESNKDFQMRRFIRPLTKGGAISPKPSCMDRVAEFAPAIEVMCGPVLSSLQIFSDDEWAQLRLNERTLAAVYVDGIGWITAVPRQIMN